MKKQNNNNALLKYNGNKTLFVVPVQCTTRNNQENYDYFFSETLVTLKPCILRNF